MLNLTNQFQTLCVKLRTELQHKIVIIDNITNSSKKVLTGRLKTTCLKLQ
jgi:hypothetical protein